MEKIHENIHVFVLLCKINFKHESTKPHVSMSIFSLVPPLHHNGKGSVRMI